MESSDGREIEVFDVQDVVQVKLAGRKVLIVPKGTVPEVAAGMIARKVGEHECGVVDDGRKITVITKVGDPNVDIRVAGRRVLTVDHDNASQVAKAMHHAAGADPRAEDVSVERDEATAAAPDTAGAGESAPAPAPSVEDILANEPEEVEQAPAPSPNNPAPWVKIGSSPGMAIHAGMVIHATDVDPEVVKLLTGEPTGVNLSTLDEDDFAMRPYRETRSWSQLTKFEECGYCYSLEVVQRTHRQPAWWFVGGRALHKMIENYELLKLEWGESPGDATAIKLFTEAFLEEIEAEARRQSDNEAAGLPAWERAEWRAAARGKENEGWWWQAGVDMARLYAEHRSDSDYSVLVNNGEPALELQFRVPINDVYFGGYIDRIIVDRNGEAWVDDYKSSAQNPKDPGQGLAYAMAVQEMYPDLVVKGCRYYMARTGEFVTYTLTYKWREILTQRLVQFDQLERSGLYLPNLSGYGHQCTFYHDSGVV